MCIYIEYLWRETQETNDCRLPIGTRTWEPDCSGVKTYFFLDLLFNAYPYSFCIFLPYSWITLKIYI